VKNLRVIVSSLMLLASTQSHAGVYGTTVHSRANCLNNETITWWLYHPYNWRVVSGHVSAFGQHHVIDSGFQYSWRSHAIHWGEGDLTNLWQVFGQHFLYEYSKTVPFDTTYATFCDLIHGWNGS